MPITPATATHSSSNGTADAILLELVDENGVTIGTAEKLSAHQPPGRLHRAFSVFLFDERGRLLLQQRALGKYHSPVCGPTPAAVTPTPARRRSRRRPGGPTRSWASPLAARRGGHGALQPPRPGLRAGGAGVQPPLRRPGAGRAAPDPEEVAETAFVDPAELAERHAKDTFSAWFMTVLDAARPAVRELTGPSAGW